MLPINSKVIGKGQINRWYCTWPIQKRGKITWENECLLIEWIELALKLIPRMQFRGRTRIEQSKLIYKSSKIRTGVARTVRF
mgnify:CR=1 FL=1